MSAYMREIIDMIDLYKVPVRVNFKGRNFKIEEVPTPPVLLYFWLGADADPG